MEIIKARAYAGISSLPKSDDLFNISEYIKQIENKLHRRNIQLADYKNKLIKAYEKIEKLQERINL